MLALIFCEHISIINYSYHWGRILVKYIHGVERQNQKFSSFPTYNQRLKISTKCCGALHINVQIMNQTFCVTDHSVFYFTWFKVTNILVLILFCMVYIKVTTVNESRMKSTICGVIFCK